MNRLSTFLLLVAITLLLMPVHAAALSFNDNDSTSNWTSAGNYRLTFNQIQYSNWTQGGEDSFTGNTSFDYTIKYDDKKMSSVSTIIGGYGIILTSEDGFRKNDDKLQMSSKLGYTISKKIKYSVLFDLKTQFSPGYKYPNDSVMVSDFFAPGYLTLSFGADWNPLEYLSILLSPASGKFTIVSDQDLADNGKYGVKPAVLDTAGIVIIPGNRFKGEFGMNFVFSYKKDLIKNVNLTSKLELHNNYFALEPSNRWNFDVDMETRVNFTINKYLSSLIYVHLLYDDDVLVALYDDDGVEIGKGPRLQMKEHVGFGLSFKF